jgi:hypothetical protein
MRRMRSGSSGGICRVEKFLDMDMLYLQSVFLAQVLVVQSWYTIRERDSFRSRQLKKCEEQDTKYANTFRCYRSSSKSTFSTTPR